MFCVAFIFCDLRLIFVLCLFYVHLHHLFAVILYNATNSSDTDTAGKHKICKTRFVRTHKLPIAPCSMPFNVCFDEIILNFVPPFFFNTYFCFQCNLHKHKKQTQTQTQEQTHTTNTQHKHTAHKHTSGSGLRPGLGRTFLSPYSRSPREPLAPVLFSCSSHAPLV